MAIGKEGDNKRVLSIVAGLGTSSSYTPAAIAKTPSLETPIIARAYISSTCESVNNGGTMHKTDSKLKVGGYVINTSE
jgi:hypothetical protein